MGPWGWTILIYWALAVITFLLAVIVNALAAREMREEGSGVTLGGLVAGLLWPLTLLPLLIVIIGMALQAVRAK